MARTAAFDLGDAWIGVALSDPLGIIGSPFTTVPASELHNTVRDLIETHHVTTIVIGHPQTLRGTVSKQTEKVEAIFTKLQTDFPNITWTLWDERLTSKQASHIKKAKDKKAKLEQHAIAAALILNTYLQYKAFSAQ